ncbi:hypothetical protein EC988_008686 [Linderina pennispora]|nr:hypothetical protein EC988_008686 [Linderina pennispora]
MTNEMTIYVGSLSQLWLDVHASSLVPRHSWLPQHIPSWTESLLQYVLSFSIALCLLNAIPAWYLDGDHALRLVLAAIEGKTDAEAAVVLGKTGERVHKIY